MLERLADIQRALGERDLEGWLFYDFRGQNPLAQRALGLSGVVLTRRFFYWIPADGEPVLVVHEVEARPFPSLPGRRVSYRGWHGLREQLAGVLPAGGNLLMEYCPMGSNPYLSLVDAGTVELVRSYGPNVASSADLIQQFLCRWRPEQLESARRAAAAIAHAKDQSLALLADGLRSGRPPNELELQAAILARFAEADLESGGPPLVAFGDHTADVHYMSDSRTSRTLAEGDLVLLDLSARERIPDGVFIDLTWMAYAGASVPDEPTSAFAVIAAARDAAVDLIRARAAAGERMLGFEVDRAARDTIEAAGLADRFFHRTGHYLGSVMNSGDGATLDDYEIHDTRELLPGLAWSIHPGLYFEDYGLRSGLSLYLGEDGPELCTPAQPAIDALLT